MDNSLCLIEVYDNRELVILVIKQFLQAYTKK